MTETIIAAFIGMALFVFVAGIIAYARRAVLLRRQRRAAEELRAVRLRARYRPTREQQDSEREQAIDRLSAAYRSRSHE